MQSQLEDSSRKNGLNIKFIQEENALLLLKERNEKEIENKKLIEVIENLEKANDDLFTRVEENYKAMQDYKKSFHYKLKDLNEIIENKEQENINTKVHYEKIVAEMAKEFEEENKKIMDNYEDRIKR